MTNLTGKKHKSSEQHLELGQSRKTRDNKDLSTFISWFQSHNPFNSDAEGLRSLSSGITASNVDNVNCDDCESVGEKIQRKLDGVSFDQCSIKRNDQVNSLASIKIGVTFEGKSISIDPCVLFNRLTMLIKQEEKRMEMFKYELTPEPTALFKDGYMRRPNKSILRNKILGVNCLVSKPKVDRCVVDGGSLLHKTVWTLNSTYNDIASQYLKYLNDRYSSIASEIVVVFDGYDTEYSTKTDEHSHRNQGVSISADINITNPDMLLSVKKNSFLRNTRNKNQLIKLICKKLHSNDIVSIQAEGDADFLIVKTAMDFVNDGKTTVVAAEDTDVLVMIKHHWDVYMEDLYFMTTVSKGKAKLTTIFWSARKAIHQFQHTRILFAHAWTGCDTTSAIHQKGKYFNIVFSIHLLSNRFPEKMFLKETKKL